MNRVHEVRGVVLDWSGTLIDAYSIAPAKALVLAFAAHGVEIAMPTARKQMGLRKDLHIRSLLAEEEVRAGWGRAHGNEPGDEDAERVHAMFKAELHGLLPEHARLLPGVPEACAALRERGIKIGVTTGFDRDTVDALLPLVERQGFVPDCAIAGDDVENGSRPNPFMLFRALERMGVSPVHAVLKVDDTPAGIGEGLAAGCWTAGVCDHSSLVGIDSLEQEWELPEGELEARREGAKAVLEQAGAHFVVGGVDRLSAVVDQVAERYQHNGHND